MSLTSTRSAAHRPSTRNRGADVALAVLTIADILIGTAIVLGGIWMLILAAQYERQQPMMGTGDNLLDDNFMGFIWGCVTLVAIILGGYLLNVIFGWLNSPRFRDWPSRKLVDQWFGPMLAGLVILGFPVAGMLALAASSGMSLL